MAASTNIANMAISHLGISKEIGNLDTEKSAEAAACRTFYETARDETLRDFPWPFATKFVALGLVETDPTDEWSFSYRYPSDCLNIRRILSGLRNDNRDSRASYKIGRDDDGVLIYTDIENASIEYTIRDDEVERYTPDFKMAFSCRLAALIAPRITKGDPFKMRDAALKMYQMELSKAHANAANEEQPDREPESEFIRARDGLTDDRSFPRRS